MSPAFPKTCKVAIFKNANEPLTFEDVELKEPGEGEVLIKVLATGLCHSDADVQTAKFGNPFPMVPGHETIGDIVAVGAGEKLWKVGDRVGGGWHGGHDDAEYCTLRSEATVRIPHDVDPAAYCPLLCAGVTVFNGMRRMKITPGETVGIQGLGGLGHLALQYASKMGYRVVALSSGASKEKFARDLGASDYVDGSKTDQAEYMKNLGGAGLIVSTAPNREVVGQLVGGLAPEGKLLILSRKFSYPAAGPSRSRS
ncbi:hypothetical protein MMC29_005211 [Sticta canariensis]|nr:hypothetical protein [Sticta canariensis]